MKSFLDELLGLHADVHTLAPGQAAARAVLLFAVALVLLRLSGRRTFGGNSALDLVVKFMFGAVLARAIVADAPILNSVLGAATLALLHRLLAYLLYLFPALRRLVKGSASVLVEGGTIHQPELRRASLSEADLRAGVRHALHTDELADAQTVRLEHDGTITAVRSRSNPATEEPGNGFSGHQ